MIRLKAKSDYTSRYRDKKIGYAAGDIIEASEDLADFLSRDAPENFVEVKGKAPASPSMDKAVSSPSDLQGLTIKQLKGMAKERELKFSRSIKKDELIELLS